jgi:hypothetical protein
MNLPKHAGLFATFFLLLGSLVGTANAQRIPPPPCPSKDCSKVVTFYNNTSDPVFAVIQAGVQSPDPWLQALFNDNTQTYAETHYSRVYINPLHGIPAAVHGIPGHVSVTVPWYSKLLNDPGHDTYADWYKAGRIVLFDSVEALNAATNQHPHPPLQFDPHAPVVSCNDCEQPLTFYSDTLAYDPLYPFQLLEYTFATVESLGPGRPPNISSLNIGYNISYLDQIYLPAALAPCGTEPCNSPDPTAVGYLGTIQALSDFRTTLTHFSGTEGWPRYNGPNDDASRPRLPGAYNVLVDRINVLEKGETSRFTGVGASVTDLMAQWNTCTSRADRVNCPEYGVYQEINNYFKENYANYLSAPSGNCPPSANYPIPPPPGTPLDIMAQVYGWTQFNSGCEPKGSFNDLKTSPGPEARFTTTQDDYIELQYNYKSLNNKPKKQRFNPFVDLIHGQLNANSYAFSIDDTAGYQQHPGQGLIIAIGGANGLPNPHEVEQDPDFKRGDFLVTLAEFPDNRPRWKSFGVCKNVTDKDFPPGPPNATKRIIVHSLEHNISPLTPCTITVTDAIDRVYQFKVLKPVPWPAYAPAHPPDSSVVSCRDSRSESWCEQITEGAILNPKNFYLNTIPTDPRP